MLLFVGRNMAIIKVEEPMNLTIEQVTAIKDGEPVRVTLAEVGTACVVVRADVYDHSTTRPHNDTELSPRELYHFVDGVMAEEDAGDPTLADYQIYRRKP
jgi:hypothetical protein